MASPGSRQVLVRETGHPMGFRVDRYVLEDTGHRRQSGGACGTREGLRPATKTSSRLILEQL